MARFRRSLKVTWDGFNGCWYKVNLAVQDDYKNYYNYYFVVVVVIVVVCAGTCVYWVYIAVVHMYVETRANLRYSEKELPSTFLETKSLFGMPLRK